MNWDVITVIANYIPEYFKTFRLVSKKFSENVIKNINLDYNDAEWLVKMNISCNNKTDQETLTNKLNQIKKHLILVQDRLLYWLIKTFDENYCLMICKYAELNGLIPNNGVILGIPLKPDKLTTTLVEIIDYRHTFEEILCSISEKGYLEFMKFIVAHKVNLEQSYNSILLYASKSNNVEMLKYLIFTVGPQLEKNKQENPETKSHQDRGKCITFSNEVQGKYLANLCNGDTYFHYLLLTSIADTGNLEMTKFIHSLGINLTAFGNKLVVDSCRNGHIKIVKYLISIDSNVFYPTEDAMVKASQYGHLNIVEYLVSLGMQVDVPGNWSVILAAENGHLNVVKYLVSQGADFMIRSCMAKRMAIKNNHTDVVQFLESIGG